MSENSGSKERSPTPSLVTVADIVRSHEREDFDEQNSTNHRTLWQRFRYYSPIRIFFGLIILAALAFGTTHEVKNVIANDVKVQPEFFAPYVDVTLTPTYQFQTTAYNVAKQTVFSFITAPSKGGCSPSWGGYYSLGGAESQLNLSRRFIEYENLGGTPIISFGGQRGQHLSTVCKTATALADAYRQVIETYHVTELDFDTEGPALNNSIAMVSRAKALGILEREYPKLRVWLTLPVALNGLDENALDVINLMLADHVGFVGINTMTMDFGSPQANMGSAAENALTDTETQLSTVFLHHGIHYSARQIYNRMGATVLIGQNNNYGEIFTVQDAHSLVSFARSHALRRVSMWSLNRDSACPSTFGDQEEYSNTCSGTSENFLQFSSIFSQSLNGAVTRYHSVIEGPTDTTTNPANAPYPIWQPSFPYPENYKVVWNGYVYEAKYYTQGSQPTQDYESSSQSPWLLIGPVLKTDHAPTLPTLPPGKYSAWSSTRTYSTGTDVELDGLGYQAKYYNQGDNPLLALQDPNTSPWKPLFSYPGEPPLN